MKLHNHFILNPILNPKLTYRDEAKRQLFPPELLMLLGINVCVILSLVTSIFDKPFPLAVPYVFQIVALAGFGQIYVNYAFLSDFVDARFWCSLLYLSAAVVGVVTVNLYTAIGKKQLVAAGALLGAFTIPTVSLSLFLVSAYLNGLTVWVPPFPIVPLEALYIVFLPCIVILGLSTIVYFEPNMLKKLAMKGKPSRQVSSRFNPGLSPTDDTIKEKR